MKKLFLLFVFTLTSSLTMAQFQYEASSNSPFCQPNPEAPSQIVDYAPLIGLSECLSETRNPDGTWNEPTTMFWKWKYIMNGMGIQDETFQEGRFSAGSIRQFNADSAAWYVHYYSSNSPIQTLPTWKGDKKENEEITLYRKQAAPNGMDGFFKITFQHITDSSFYWLGTWVNEDETITYPTWKINCNKIGS